MPAERACEEGILALVSALAVPYYTYGSEGIGHWAKKGQTHGLSRFEINWGGSILEGR